MVLNKSEETGKVLQLLNWAYEQSLTGLPGMGSAIELARDYDHQDGTMEDKVNSLIRWQISKTATSGFLTGLGGIITLPFAIPADLATSVYVQIRMIAAIAHLGGYDIKSDRVKTMVYMCLVGESAKDILKDAGIQIGLKTGKTLVTRIPGEVLVKINQMVGFRLVTKFGSKGAVNLVKIVPFFGGVVGASINAITTNIVGNYARDTFIKAIPDEPVTGDFIDPSDLNTIYPNIELLKFYSYINIIKVDGARKDEEIHLFDTLISNSLLDEHLKAGLIEKLNADHMEKVDYSLFLNNPEQSVELLKNLVLIATCDGELHISEKLFIKSIGNQFGFEDNDLEQLINETRPGS